MKSWLHPWSQICATAGYQKHSVRAVVVLVSVQGVQNGAQL